MEKWGRIKDEQWSTGCFKLPLFEKPNANGEYYYLPQIAEQLGIDNEIEEVIILSAKEYEQLIS